jgi:S1 RNA binding domain protein
MQPELGATLEGKVTGITKFGAFVTMPDGKSGLVHISEIANAYVNDVNDYLQMGQEVKVKVVGVTPEGKINLSIKKAIDAPPREHRETRDTRRPQQNRERQDRPSAPSPRPNYGQQPQQGQVYGQSNNKSFEDKLKQFMQESDSRISGNRLYAEKKSSRRRRD